MSIYQAISKLILCKRRRHTITYWLQPAINSNASQIKLIGMHGDESLCTY